MSLIIYELKIKHTLICPYSPHQQGSINCIHGDEHVCNMHTKIFTSTKLCVHKSIQTPLSSTPMFVI